MGITADENSILWILVAVFVLMFVFIGIAILGSVRRRQSSSKLESAKNTTMTSEAEMHESVVKAVLAEPDKQNKTKDKIEDKTEDKAEDKAEDKLTVAAALKNTEKNFLGRLKGLFRNEAALKNFDELEEILLTSDLGPQTVQRLMTKLESLSGADKSNFEKLKAALREEFFAIFSSSKPDAEKSIGKTPDSSLVKSTRVWMIVGVNGAGKTTSIGKLAAQMAESGKKVLVAAGDTFRAAASEQLKTWSERASKDVVVEFFSPEGVTDPSAVAFAAVTKAKEKQMDVVLVDTAGRLHTQTNLMEELKKVKRVMAKVLPDAPHEVILILDANSGQNALFQAREFHQALDLTGVILTKMDGTAKGGVAVGLAHELKVPIRWIGIGEKVSDLRPFSSQEFVDSILGDSI